MKEPLLHGKEGGENAQNADAENGFQKKEEYSMRDTANFILAVVGFILFCILIAKFVMTPLFKKFPALEKANKAFLDYSLVRDIIHLFK